MINGEKGLETVTFDDSRINTDGFVNVSMLNALTIQQKVFEKTGNIYEAFLSKVMAIDELENLCSGLEFVDSAPDSKYSQQIADFKKSLNEKDERIFNYKVANFKLRLLTYSVRHHAGLNFEGRI